MGFWNVYDKKGEYVGSISDSSCTGPNPVLVLVLELIAVIGIAFLFGKDMFNWYFENTMIWIPLKESPENGLSELFSYWKNGGFAQKIDVVQTILPPAVGFVLIMIRMIQKGIKKDLGTEWILNPIMFIVKIFLNLCVVYLFFSMIGSIFDRAGLSVGDAFIIYFVIYWFNTMTLLLAPGIILLMLKACGIFRIFEGIANILGIIFPFLS